MISNIKIFLFVTLIHVLVVYLAVPMSFSKNEDIAEILPISRIVEQELKSRGLKFTSPTIIMSDLAFHPDSYAVTKGAGLFKYIEVNKNDFKKMPHEIKEALILHEYGHYLGIWTHFNDRKRNSYAQGCPKSVMHESDMMQNCFYNYRNYYYNELVSRVIDLQK